MTQEQFSGEVSHTSVMIYQQYLPLFQMNPGNSTNF
jgi:alkyl sulfatase BDS1-like metallo-beta-lactamase superfamily hydrolase